MNEQNIIIKSSINDKREEEKMTKILHMTMIQLLIISYHSFEFATTKKSAPMNGQILNDIIIDLFDANTKRELSNPGIREQQESGLNINLKIDYSADDKPPSPQPSITTTKKTTSRIINSSTTYRSLQNREIKIVYKGSPKIDAKSKDSGLNSIISFDEVDYKDGSSISAYYLVRINKDFLVLVSSILFVVFLTLFAVISLFKCFKSKNDSYYYYKYRR